MTAGRIAGLAALTLLALALGGCGSTPKTSFYTLGAGPAKVDSAPAPAAFRVTVGPVTVPDLVDRPQLVVRVAANQVVLLDQHHWAEPLRSEIPRVIVADLAKLLGGAQVSAYPRSGGEPEYRVRVDIQDFESAPGDGVSLYAGWLVQRSAPSEARAGHFTLRVPAGGPGYDALVSAHRVALAQMSKEIADAIRAMEAQPR
jgi:uncharacterized lipoprotein YmbA